MTSHVRKTRGGRAWISAILSMSKSAFGSLSYEHAEADDPTTGNNIVLLGDLTQRSLLCSLDPKHERPETRVFERNPLVVAKAQRPRFVAAALTILRGFHIAGRPSSAGPLGSFEAWSALVRSALLWLGCADPAGSMDALRKADPRRSDHSSVIGSRGTPSMASRNLIRT